MNHKDLRALRSVIKKRWQMRLVILKVVADAPVPAPAPAPAPALAPALALKAQGATQLLPNILALKVIVKSMNHRVEVFI